MTTIMRAYWAIGTSFFLLIGILGACSGSSGPSPASTPRTATEHLKLSVSNESFARSYVTADVDDRVNVAVKVLQRNDQYARCGKPLMKDSFGNAMAELAPTAKAETESTIAWSYAYAFSAPASGRYSVEFVNSECNVRMTSAEADITWTVYPPPKQ